MNKMIINGKVFIVEGNNISVGNGCVIVDGKVVQSELSGIVKVQFEGDLASLKSDCSIEVHGDIKGNTKSGGSMTCRNIEGNVSTGGSVHCGNVVGDIDAGGSIHCLNHTK